MRSADPSLLAGLGVILCLPALWQCGAAPAAPIPVAVACPPTAVPAVPAASVTAGAAALPLPDAGERAALFADLVGAVRKYHMFSAVLAKSLGRRWDDDLPALESAFASAETEPLLRDALGRFGASLHDAHCVYSAEKQGERLRSDVALDVEWIGGAPRFYLASTSPALGPEARPGDVVVSLNGVPAERFLEENMLRSSGNTRRRIAEDLAAWVGHRFTMESSTRAGDTERLVLRHRDGGGELPLTITWKPDPIRPPLEDDPAHAAFDDIDYARARCAPDLRDVDYGGGYRLSAHGKLFCLYTSTKAPFDAHPIVRHFSFRYSGAFQRKPLYPAYIEPGTAYQVEADHHALRALLRAGPRVAGLILDLRNNRGGNDSRWFLDWYAPGPYVDTFLRVPRLADWSDPQFKARVENLDDAWTTWYPAAEKAAAGPFLRRPFFCENAACSGDNRQVPAHGVVDAPVALLVGPGCGSACAAVALVFDENDYGPLIGEPTGASYTTYRLQYPVRTRAGRELGTLGLALSHDESGKTGEDFEGRDVHVDYPVARTFDGRARWDAELVAAAVRSFHEFKFPRRTAKLGPL